MPDKPNILFIFSDQQRWDTLGCYGNPVDVTPNLDAMADDGVRFHNAFTCQPVCGPARSCLQTGLYATETGCWRNGIALPVDIPTTPRRLRAAGYEVGYIGKWHLASTGKASDYRGKPVPPELRGGYDDYWLASDVLEFTSHGYDGHMFNADMEQVDFPEGRYRVDALTGFALEYLRTRDRKRPFFLFLSFIEPHHQNDHKHFEGPTGSKERFKNAPIPEDLLGADGDWPEEWPDYLGCCARLDEAVGCLRAELDALGLADDTLVIYTSDHACHFRTRNSEYKRSCHDNSIRVPMVINGPGFKGGRVVDNLVSLIDLPPTLITAAGADASDVLVASDVPVGGMRGRPLQPLANGTAEDWLDEVFVQISESQTGRAIRTKRWKYSVRAAGGSASDATVYYEDFLYDLDADPHEKHNLVHDPAHEETRSTLRERLLLRIAEAGEVIPEIRPPAHT